MNNYLKVAEHISAKASINDILAEVGNSITAIIKSSAVKISMLATGIALAGVMNPLELKAQSDTAVHMPNWAKYVMIGKNDPNDASSNNHIITLGGGASGANNAGLWYIAGSYMKAFHIGRTFNMTINNSSSHTGGRHMIFIDSTMRIGIDYWPHQISQGHKLDVFGKVRAEGLFTLSDSRFKRDVKPINNLDDLLKINPVQYKNSGEAFRVQLAQLAEKGKYLSESDFEIAKTNLEHMIAERDADPSINFGFVAQELREVFPNLVNEDQNGFLSVDYSSLIPVLVNAIQEQQKAIQKQNERIEALEGKGFEKTATVISTAKLYQNNPNPFSENTEIKYYVPENANEAMICIYDLTGSQIVRFDLRDRGVISTLTVRGRELKAGMYIYSLIVDGREIDTKRMILTDK